jgi:hypothetical protein
MKFPTIIASLFILLSMANAAPTEEKRQGKSPQIRIKRLLDIF